MSNDMAGQGQLNLPKGFPMDPSMMSGMQNATVNQALIGPDYSVDVDVYFDVPIRQNKDLSIEWSRGSGKVGFPVSASGAPTAHNR